MFARNFRSEDDKSELVDTLKECVDGSGDMNVNAYSGKSEVTTKSRSSKKQIAREVIIKMREKPTSYEETDAIHRWEILFTVGQDYSSVELSKIKEAHER